MTDEDKVAFLARLMQEQSMQFVAEMQAEADDDTKMVSLSPGRFSIDGGETWHEMEA